MGSAQIKKNIYKGEQLKHLFLTISRKWKATKTFQVKEPNVQNFALATLFWLQCAG